MRSRGKGQRKGGLSGLQGRYKAETLIDEGKGGKERLGEGARRWDDVLPIRC